MNAPSNGESGHEKALRLISAQIQELQGVRLFNYERAEFKAWRDTTLDLLNRYLAPTSPHLSRFRGLHFMSAVWPIAAGEEQRIFKRDCDIAEATLRSVIKQITEFGPHISSSADSKTQAQERDHRVQQNFYNSEIKNFAIAGDNASIGRVGDSTGASLREIASIFEQSRVLAEHETKLGVAATEALEAETQKPKDRWDWKAVLTYGQTLLTVSEKATDVAQKLGPYLPHVQELVKHTLGKS